MGERVTRFARRVTRHASRAAVLALVPTLAAAQSVSLRYSPVLGARVQTISDVKVSSLVFGLPSLPDSTLIESDWRTVQTARVLQIAAPRGMHVRLSIDSSRSRARAGAAQRVDVPLPGAEGLVIEGVVGPRLNFASTTPVTRGADSAFVATLRARLAGLEFVLPETPIQPGQSWESPLAFPFGAHLTLGGRLSSTESLRGTATVTMDSLSVRGADTLVFLRLEGTLEPKTVVVAGEGGIGTGQATGRIVAAIVWSTGWNAVVSAVTNGRLALRVRLGRTEGLPIEGTATLTVSGRHQVRW